MENNREKLRIAELRARYKMSQEDLARKIGYTRQAVGMWETGERGIDNDTLIKLSEIFGVSIDYILGKDNQDSNNAFREVQMVIKFRHIEAKPPLYGVIIALVMLIASIVTLFVPFTSRIDISLIFLLSWLIFYIVAIVSHILLTKKHTNTLAFSSKQRAYFELKNNAHQKLLRPDYFGHFLFLITFSVTFIFLVGYSRNIMNDASFANSIVASGLLLLILIVGVMVSTLIKPSPVPKFPYYETNKYHGLFWYDLLFFVVFLFSIFVFIILLAYGPSNTGQDIYIVCVSLVILCPLLAFLLRFERRLLFQQYKITIE